MKICYTGGILILLLSSPVLALEQPIGDLRYNINVGAPATINYSLRDETTSPQKINIDIQGDVSKYISYPKELVLNPGLTRLSLNATIPDNYSGARELHGIITATYENRSNPQVKVITELGKRITLDIQDKTLNIQDNSDYKTEGFDWISISGMLNMIFIGIIIDFQIKIKRKGEKR
jgi:hypothetical protein